MFDRKIVVTILFTILKILNATKMYLLNTDLTKSTKDFSTSKPKKIYFLCQIE